MNTLRMSYHEVNSKLELKEFIKTYQNIECSYSLPYLASAHMQQAEFTMMPHLKLKYFKEGKLELESYIEEYPNDIEGRYVRFLIQSNLPSFLGYSENISSDKEFIMRNLNSSTLSEEYKEVIRDTINKIDKE
ncbi:hypothetical protein [Membranihabitans marinus]|uniref:hypothetical protein n=1 Tax=Membranihabitans marinus TaxID=1227546 RepID=UPI001F475085|nr:hypothetical protein [Membranihabitans marinus]